MDFAKMHAEEVHLVGPVNCGSLTVRMDLLKITTFLCTIKRLPQANIRLGWKQLS
jgi:hypothetical protein